MLRTGTWILLMTAFIPALAGGMPAPGEDVWGRAPQSDATPVGPEITLNGVIVKREGTRLLLRNHEGVEVVVTFSERTEVLERKNNPFRRAKVFGFEELMRGLNVEAKGRMNTSGALMAGEIRFTQDDLKIAHSLESRVYPVEERLEEAGVLLENARRRIDENEQRLAENEENSRRLAGQLEEVQEISNEARGGARAAQDTADSAVHGVKLTNERISALDDYDIDETLTVLFPFASADLSAEARRDLNRLAEAAQSSRGYFLEVTGFASSDGNADFNRRLSERRAQNVVRYLLEEHEIPLRRIISPHGFGEAQPVADNATQEGRRQNRRVEVRLLINKALVESTQVETLTGELVR